MPVVRVKFSGNGLVVDITMNCFIDRTTIMSRKFAKRFLPRRDVQGIISHYKKREREIKGTCSGASLVAAVKAGAGWMLDNLLARLPSQNSHNQKPQNSKQNSSLALRIEWLGGKKTEKEEMNFREGV
jgi:hypothetical protein